jgi:hypothetical protein
MSKEHSLDHQREQEPAQAYDTRQVLDAGSVSTSRLLLESVAVRLRKPLAISAFSHHV